MVNSGEPRFTVHFVEPNPSVAALASSLLEEEGLNVRVYVSAVDLQNRFEAQPPECVIIRPLRPANGGPAQLAGVNGPEESAEDRESREERIEQEHAVYLVASVRRAIDEIRTRSLEGSRRHEFLRGIDSLSRREREVAELVLEGHSSKRVARILSISKRTIDFHRASILRKLGIDSMVALVSVFRKDSELTDRLRPS